jgi:hypothetical protein
MPGNEFEISRPTDGLCAGYCSLIFHDTKKAHKNGLIKDKKKKPAPKERANIQPTLTLSGILL